MFVVGVTGGIGSGKSTVTNLFSKLGVKIIDADVIARDLVASGSRILVAIAEHFGPDVLLEDGQLNRSKLRDIIFTDEEAKTWLESQLHPEVRKQILEEVKRSKTAYTIVSAPLMLETGLDRLMDRLLVVDVPESGQIERTVRRDNTSEGKVKEIILSQADRGTRLKKADDIIDNAGTLHETQRQVENLHMFYLSLAQNKQES